MTDPLLTTSLIVSLGLTVVFYVKWRRAQRNATEMFVYANENLRRAWRAEDEASALRLALARKVESEFDGDSGPGEAA
jgi:hypothetical protein